MGEQAHPSGNGFRLWRLEITMRRGMTHNRRLIALSLAALVVGLAIAWNDSRPTWDDTGITAGLLVMAAALFGVVDPRRWWLGRYWWASGHRCSRSRARPEVHHWPRSCSAASVPPEEPVCRGSFARGGVPRQPIRPRNSTTRIRTGTTSHRSAWASREPTHGIELVVITMSYRMCRAIAVEGRIDHGTHSIPVDGAVEECCD